jgi:imidazolonepropionase-like amidohydrolase
MAEVVFALDAAGIPLVIATDGPEMIGTRLRAEHAMLVRLGALTADAARRANARARDVSFIPPSPIGAEAAARAGS